MLRERIRDYLYSEEAKGLLFQPVEPALAYWQANNGVAAASQAAASQNDIVLTDAEGKQTRVDDSWAETFPYGAFAFDTSAVDAKEGDDTVTTVSSPSFTSAAVTSKAKAP